MKEESFALLSYPYSLRYANTQTTNIVPVVAPAKDLLRVGQAARPGGTTRSLENGNESPEGRKAKILSFNWNSKSRIFIEKVATLGIIVEAEKLGVILKSLLPFRTKNKLSAVGLPSGFTIRFHTK